MSTTKQLWESFPSGPGSDFDILQFFRSCSGSAGPSADELTRFTPERFRLVAWKGSVRLQASNARRLSTNQLERLRCATITVSGIWNHGGLGRVEKNTVTVHALFPTPEDFVRAVMLGRAACWYDMYIQASGPTAYEVRQGVLENLCRMAAHNDYCDVENDGETQEVGPLRCELGWMKIVDRLRHENVSSSERNLWKRCLGAAPPVTANRKARVGSPIGAHPLQYTWPSGPTPTRSVH